MNPFGKTLAASLSLVFGLGACAGSGNNAAPDNGNTEIPVVEIGDCQTAVGTQDAAEPTGADYNEQLKEPGVLHVGSDNAYPPFEEIPPGAETPEGFDVDLYTEVAERLELEAKSTTTDFDGLFSQSVPNGTFDIGVSAITITEERKDTVDFTVPYFRSDLSLSINSEETPDLATIDDLTGLTIGAQKGTTGEACAEVLVTQGKAKEVKSYSDAAAAFQDLQAGRISAVVNDQLATIGFVDKIEELEVVQVIQTDEVYGFAISKDKPDLRVAIDEALTEIMNDGTFATLYEKWFEVEPPFEVPIST